MYKKGIIILKKQLNQIADILSIRIVLDRSGSMQGSEKITIKALNTYLKN